MVYRLGSYIPVPGLDPRNLASLFNGLASFSRCVSEARSKGPPCEARGTPSQGGRREERSSGLLNMFQPLPAVLGFAWR